MFRAALLLAAFACALIPAAYAAEYGTREEAIAMVKRVQEKFQKEGAEPTFKAVNDKNFKLFHQRDLYPFIYDLTGINVAHGANITLIGKNLIDFKDQNGKFLIRELVEAAKSKTGNGWVDYRWVNPTNQKVEDKSAYVERMGDYLVGVGIYRQDMINLNTIGFVSGTPQSDATSLQIAFDLASVLNDGDNLRILPIVGIGGAQNIRDVRTLRGVDVGLTQINILNSFRRANQELGYNDDKIVYICPLFNEEMHIIVRPDILSLEQLNGKTVNMDTAGSTASAVMRDVFARLGIRVEEVNLPQAEAVAQLRTGKIAATAVVAGKPAQSVANLDFEDGFRILPVTFAGPLTQDYVPAVLTHDDYPNLIPVGRTVPTIASGNVLIAFDWPKENERYKRVEKFIEAFFSRVDDFQQKPRHPKWREVNVNADLPGWKRFPAAEQWLASHKDVTVGTSRGDFYAFIAKRNISNASLLNMPPEERQALFQQFLQWYQSGKQQ
jgi:TRAP-type uncharacterized transport system substrate-binding protein